MPNNPLYIIWKDGYNLDIEEIDNQHKHLFELINSFYQAIIEKRTSPIIGETLKELVEFANEHFEVENRFMKLVEYPESANHYKIHEEIKRDMSIISTQFKQNIYNPYYLIK